jgi:hypothetical protein
MVALGPLSSLDGRVALEIRSFDRVGADLRIIARPRKEH